MQRYSAAVTIVEVVTRRATVTVDADSPTEAAAFIAATARRHPERSVLNDSVTVRRTWQIGDVDTVTAA